MPRWGCSIKKYLCEKSLEEDMAINSRILAWSILWTKEPGGLQSMELQRVRHKWSDLTHTHEKQVDFCNILQNLSGLRASLFLTHSKSSIDVPGLLAFGVALFQTVLGYLGCSNLQVYLVAIHLATMKGRRKEGKCLPKPLSIFNHFVIEVKQPFSSHFISQNKSHDFT